MGEVVFFLVSEIKSGGAIIMLFRLISGWFKLPFCEENSDL